MLLKEELIQYSRQMMLPDIGLAGQTALKQAHALIIGMGGLGSPVAMYLASAGVGRLSLVDADVVERSNLQRQIIHQEHDIGCEKVASAAATIAALNPHCVIEQHATMLDDNNAAALLADADVVIDASDNFATRFLVNQQCQQQGVALVSGAAIRFEAQVFVIRHDQPTPSPCYNCLFSADAEHAANCATAGIIAPLVGVIGSLQALEAMKIILGFGADGKTLHVFDAMHSNWRALHVAIDPDCPTCTGTHRGNTPAIA